MRVYRCDSTETGKKEAQRLNRVIQARNRYEYSEDSAYMHRQAMLSREKGRVRNFTSANDAREAMMKRQETNPSRQHN